MKRSFKLLSYGTAFTELGCIDMLPGTDTRESELGMKGKISGDPVEVLGLL